MIYATIGARLLSAAMWLFAYGLRRQGMSPTLAELSVRGVMLKRIIEGGCVVDGVVIPAQELVMTPQETTEEPFGRQALKGKGPFIMMPGGEA